MKPARIRWLAAAAALFVLLAGYLSLNRAVTIVADGRTTTILTRAVTVGGAPGMLAFKWPQRTRFPRLPFRWSAMGR